MLGLEFDSVKHGYFLGFGWQRYGFPVVLQHYIFGKRGIRFRELGSLVNEGRPALFSTAFNVGRKLARPLALASR